MNFKTCRTKYGGCGYPFRTTHNRAYLCDECKEKKYGDRTKFINKHLPEIKKVNT